MTRNQFNKYISKAKKYGEVVLNDNSRINFFNDRFIVTDPNGNTVDVSYYPEKLYYLFE